MKKTKTHSLATALLVTAILAGCEAAPEASPESRGTPNVGESPAATETASASPATDDAAEREAVAAVVEQFGKQLQLVSLLAPAETVRESIREHYGEYVTPKLLEAWLNDPSEAPGRQVSSPWPDRIEIGEITAADDSVYEVTGEMVEITGAGNEIAARIPVTLRWSGRTASGGLRNLRRENPSHRDGNSRKTQCAGDGEIPRRRLHFAG
jgi:hypothetical protein